jgi:class 3 adenylate cyclase
LSAAAETRIPETARATAAGREGDAPEPSVSGCETSELRSRAGVHVGEIEQVGKDIRGIAVHIGARVASLAVPSQILVSSTVKDLVAGSGLTFENAGKHELKGVPDRWHLYRVLK